MKCKDDKLGEVNETSALGDEEADINRESDEKNINNAFPHFL